MPAIEIGVFPVYTIGHSNRTIDRFLAMVRQVQIEIVIDIRKIPMSRANPQFNGNNLERDLAVAKIDYTRLEALGGRRNIAREIAPETNAFWENRSFHNYADYALSEAFREGLSELEQLSHSRRAAIMCSEAVWWRCHRRLVSDYLLHEGREVLHIMDLGHIVPAVITPAAREEGPSLIYPASRT
jgi:uncharacterized protein (DUF488 family)